MASWSLLARMVLCGLLLNTLTLRSAAISALSATEKSAVLQLFDAFPLLLLTGITSEWNRTAIENICDWPGSLDSFTCSAGRVVSISIDDSWGYPTRDQFDAFSGLTELTKITIASSTHTAILGSISTLIKSLADMPSLTELIINYALVVQDSTPITNLTSLQHLQMTTTTAVADFSRMTALRQLDLGFGFGPSVGPNLTTSLNTVSSTSLTGLSLLSPLSDFTALARFGKLESLVMNASLISSFSLAQLSTFSSLRQLKLNGLPSNLAILDFSTFNSNLTSLSLFDCTSIQNITAWPPAVETISIMSSTQISYLMLYNLTGVLPSTVSSVSLYGLFRMSQFPNGFFTAPASAGNLTTLSLSYMPALKTLPAELVSATSLELVEIIYTGIGNPQELCHLPTTLKRIYIEGGGVDASQGTTPLPFPACIASFTQLWDVQISTISSAGANLTQNLPSSVTQLLITSATPPTFAPYDWPSFVQSLPNLTQLRLSNCYINGTFPNELQSLKNLTHLDLGINNFAGSIDPNFFVALTASIYIDLSWNSIVGALPNQFSPTLEHLDVGNNMLTSFANPVQPHPRLSVLRLNSNQLSSIPNDTGFAYFPRLSDFAASFNPLLLGTPIPTFWANSSSISSVDLTSSGFVGQLPSEIYSPLMRRLELGNNHLCGSLPTFQPFSMLDSLALGSNNISGTIPASWSNISVSYLFLSSNRLTGTLPLGLTLSVANQLTLKYLYLDNNDFFGSLPDMSKMAGLRLFDVSNTLIDLCAANPSFPSTISTCGAANLPNNGSCACTSWYASCTSISSSCTPTVPFLPHSTGPISFSSCGTVSIAFPSAIPCDYSAQPSPAFSCINGVWNAIGSVTAPIVVSSPIVIVSGNLSAPVTITNPSSSIIVKECVSSNTTIEIVLTPSQIEALRKDATSKLVLSQLGLNCTVSASNIHVSASISGKTCKRVSVSSDVGQSNHSSLFVVFKIGTSQCNIWWIVLASVLGGLAVAGIIGFVLLFKVKSLRKRFMPATLNPRAGSWRATAPSRGTV